jgi:hypothetical protein
LGVPVSFAEINNYAALVEISDPEAGFNPDLSFGSHFFLDLVEANIFYLALFAGQERNIFNRAWIEKQANLLPELAPEEAALASLVRVCDCDLRLVADIESQKALLTKM